MISPSATAPGERICIWPTASWQRRSSVRPTTCWISKRPLCGAVLDAGRICPALGRTRSAACRPWIRNMTVGTSTPAGTSPARPGTTRPDGVFSPSQGQEPRLVGQGRGGWGAWQIAGRYDVLDLSDQNDVLVGFSGNTTQRLCVGLLICAATRKPGSSASTGGSTTIRAWRSTSRSRRSLVAAMDL